MYFFPFNLSQEAKGLVVVGYSTEKQSLQGEFLSDHLHGPGHFGLIAPHTHGLLLSFGPQWVPPGCLRKRSGCSVTGCRVLGSSRGLLLRKKKVKHAQGELCVAKFSSCVYFQCIAAS